MCGGPVLDCRKQLQEAALKLMDDERLEQPRRQSQQSCQPLSQIHDSPSTLTLYPMVKKLVWVTMAV